MMHDVVYGFRQLRRNPAFSIVAIATLALGIGANTAIFSVVNTVLLKPLPYPDAGRIVYLEGHNASHGITDSNISFADYTEWAKQTELFDATALYWVGNANLGAAEASEPERVARAGVTTGFFQVMGVQPALGRAFLPEDDQPATLRAVILSHRLWQRRFSSDPAIIGRDVFINARPLTVVGVMPPGFKYPDETEVWVTAAIEPAKEPRDNRSYSAVGRLRPGIAPEAAQARISAINAQLATAHHDTNKGWDARVLVLQDLIVRNVRPSLLALIGAVGFVLLIASANVANLIVARGTTRQKEVAIRSAMGASRARILRQLMTESLLLAGIGGIAGLIMSIWLTDVLRSIVPPNTPRFDEISLDYRVLVFALGLSILTGILFGFAPALQTARVDLNSSLKEGGRTGSQRRTAARNFLLIGEVALSLILLVGAGLLIQSFVRLQQVSPGFNPKNVLMASISLPGAKYPDEGQRPRFFEQLKQRLEVLPGVEAVGGGINLPLGASNYSIGRSYIPEGRPQTVDEAVDAGFYNITGDYFPTLQIPLLAGRFFDARDTADSPKAVIVNERVARRHYGSPEDALRKRLTIWRDEKFPREIVGVVGDSKASALERESGQQIYVPHAQDPSWPFMAMVIRTKIDPVSFVPALRREVQALDKDQPIYGARTMEEVVSNSIGTRRVSMQLFTVFAGTALLLAAIGIYGVIGYSVTQRTREIGIRMALGAQRTDVLRMIVRQGMLLVLIGIAAGFAGALAVTRLLSNLLFGIDAADPVTFAAISLLIAVVALLACYLPARRAARLNPIEALRAE